MKRRLWVVLIAALLVVGAVLPVILNRPAEPSFNGRSLSEWVKDISPTMLARNRTVPVKRVPGPRPGVIVSRGGQMFVSGGPASNAPTIVMGMFGPTLVYPPQHLTAAAAIREIGTNAIPHLLCVIYSRDGKLKTTCAKWWRKQNVVKLPFDMAEDKKAHALPALQELGPLAVWAWVEVVTNDLANSDVKTYAAHALGELGRQAMPALGALMPMMYHPDPHVAFPVIGAIMNCDRSGFFTSLYNVRCAPEANFRAAAAWSLGFMCQNADMTVPALMSALNDKSSLVRQEALLAIAKFGTSAISATNAIRRMMEDSEPGVRSTATNIFRQVLAR
jgi:hypothetical protein